MIFYSDFAPSVAKAIDAFFMICMWWTLIFFFLLQNVLFTFTCTISSRREPRLLKLLAYDAKGLGFGPKSGLPRGKELAIFFLCTLSMKYEVTLISQ